MGRIVTLTGRSGSGKTTIAREILFLYEKARALRSHVTNTREPRKNDLPGEYTYVSPREFYLKKQGFHFLWTAELSGNRYGTTNTDVSNALFDGKDGSRADELHISILTPDAVPKLMAHLEKIGELDKVGFFYITVENPDIVLPERMRARGDTEKEIAGRMLACGNWDEEARGSEVPYILVDNTDRPAKETAREILENILGSSLTREVRENDS